MIKKLVCGVGINDANYKTQIKVATGEYLPSGSMKQKKIWNCPYYLRWASMLKRCYSAF